MAETITLENETPDESGNQDPRTREPETLELEGNASFETISTDDTTDPSQNQSGVPGLSPQNEAPRKRSYKSRTNSRKPKGKVGRPRKLAAPPPDEDDEPEEEEDEQRQDAGAPAALEMDEDPEHLAALKSDLFYWLDNLSDETWSKLMVYCYRKEPVWLQDKTGGKPHYILKMSQRFSLEDLKRMHGSGIYRVDVTMGLDIGGSKRLRTGDVHIIDPQYPPNLPVSDAWTKNAVNAKWLWAIPLLEEKERQAAAQRGTPAAARLAPAGSSTAAAVAGPAGFHDDEGLVGLARRSQEQLMSLTDPSRQLATMKALSELLRPAQPQGDPAMTMLLAMMQEQNKELRAEIREMRRESAAAAAAPRDSRAIIMDTIELAEALGFRRGGAGAAQKTDPWVGFLERVVDNAQPIADMIVSLTQSRAPQPPAEHAQPQPPPQQRPRPIQPPAPEPEPEEEEDDEEGEDMTPQEREQQDLMKRLEPIIRASINPMLDAVRSNNPAALRQWFLDEYGKINFQTIKESIGPERMAQLATTHPLLKPQLPDQPTMLTFFRGVFQ